MLGKHRRIHCSIIKPLSHGPKNAGQIQVECRFDLDLSHTQVNPGYNLGRTLLPTLDRIQIKDGRKKGREKREKRCCSQQSLLVHELKGKCHQSPTSYPASSSALDLSMPHTEPQNEEQKQYLRTHQCHFAYTSKKACRRRAFLLGLL